MLDAALRAQKCGPRQLQVQDEWEWLLSEFAGQPSAQPLKPPAMPVLILQECSLLSNPCPMLMHVVHGATHQSHCVAAFHVECCWHWTESQSQAVHFTHAVMACAGFYGIRQTYTVLAHLRWAIKPENATVTAMCLDILGNELKPLKQAEAEGALLPQVTTSTAFASLLAYATGSQATMTCCPPHRGFALSVLPSLVQTDLSVCKEL